MKKELMYFLFYLSTILLSTSCGVDTPKATNPSTNSTNPTSPNHETTSEEMLSEDFDLAPDHTFPYQLRTPDKTFELPNKLKEISGLGIDATNQYLYAVQDEEGDLFVIDIATGKVVKEGEFHKDGDYEGVEIVGDRAFVVKSSGTLYEILHFKKDNQELIKHKFDFPKNSDIEGLGYDPIDNRLLISCKGKAGKGEEYEFKKGIFGLDLATMQLDDDPAYTISVEAVTQFLEVNHHVLEKVDKLIKLFQPGEEFIFGPSGVAVHPLTGDIYITSSVGKILVVLHRNGKIKHIIKLKKKVHAQPEGITFAKDGTLYISNEGKDGKAVIHRFAYQEGQE